MNEHPRNPTQDPLLDARLTRLAERSTAHRAHAASAARLGERSGAARNTTASSASSHGGRTPRTGGRAHAARGSRATALALSVGTTLGLAGYLYGAQHVEAGGSSVGAATVVSGGADSAATTAATSTAGTTAATSTVGTTATAEASTTAAPTTVTSSTGLADGTYLGGAATNRYGTVQVQITVSGGVITDVQNVQLPTGDHESAQISSVAGPLLIQETLTAQSADVDTISGATYTSDSYRQSLQTAIDAARAAATNGNG